MSKTKAQITNEAQRSKHPTNAFVTDLCPFTLRPDVIAPNNV